MRSSDLHHNFVEVRQPRTGLVFYRLAFCLLFGYSSAVTQFARLSVFLQTALRRLLARRHRIQQRKQWQTSS